jgi:hypothetical protein
LIDGLILQFSDSVDHAICLLLILKYMANECDNDSIVIEESIRSSFFNFLDQISPQVFEQIFNLWAMKINKFQLYDVDEYKLQKLKLKLIDAFYNWIKIKLPDSVFANLTQSYPDLL